MKLLLFNVVLCLSHMVVCTLHVYITNGKLIGRDWLNQSKTKVIQISMEYQCFHMSVISQS